MGFANIQNANDAVRHQQYDSGLRAYMVGVFSYMAVALLLTAIIMFLVGSSAQLARLVIGTPIGALSMIVAFAISLLLVTRIQTMSLSAAQTCLWVYAAAQGLGLSYLTLMYTGESIARAFFLTASIFGVMAFYGNTTKKDLSSWSSFLMMGLWGILFASLFNLIWWNGALSFIISIASIIVFTALTAYDTQRIKEMYYEVGGNAEIASKVAVFGALILYVDFIAIFFQIVRFIGDRREQ